MYSYIRGEIAEIREDGAVIENNGIGYDISLPASDIGRLGNIGDTKLIYTYFQVSENGIGLYGFLSKDEREMFLMLLSVSGVGPKAAISVLSVLSERDLKFAIISEDEKAISKAPGVGPKSAKRIILELKDRIDTGFIGEETGAEPSETGQLLSNNVKNDAYLALVSLGYDSSTALKTVDSVSVNEDTDSETVLKEALKKLAF